ncbi:MAG: hypothetical protein EXS13_09820 [Planctomycetes bacterium]|nr:hypothetical protein [Planctomycetota bacterium]
MVGSLLLAGSMSLVLHSPAQAATATESSSDAALPVRDGLVIWLDAARIGEADAVGGRRAPVDGTPLGVWHDGSGARRDFTQHARDAQPRLVLASGTVATSGAQAGAWVRFDGVDDVLHAATRGLEFDEWTLLVHAAPRSNGGGFRGLVAANALGRNDY